MVLQAECVIRVLASIELDKVWKGEYLFRVGDGGLVKSELGTDKRRRLSKNADFLNTGHSEGKHEIY